MQLHDALNNEFKRTARSEGITMEVLVAEVAAIVGTKRRQIYNWRSGKWNIPVNAIPALCQRFKSLSLLRALEDECRQGVEIEVPELFDLARTTSATIRHNLEAYEQVLDHFESDGGVQPHELTRIRELMERVIGDAYRFLEIAKTDCERRHPEEGVGSRVSGVSAEEAAADLRR